MNIRHMIAVSGLVAGVAVSGAVQAQAANAPYFGAKLASMALDCPGGFSCGSALNIGGYVGMQVLDLRRSGAAIPGTIAVEGELTTTVIKGKMDYTVPFFGTTTGTKWGVTTLGGYGVYRSPDANNIYFKGKLGLVYSNFSVSTFGGTSWGTSTDISWGIGAGYKLTQRNAVELELTMINDLTVLSLGYTF